jgi:hypothetical protein
LDQRLREAGHELAQVWADGLRGGQAPVVLQLPLADEVCPLDLVGEAAGDALPARDGGRRRLFGGGARPGALVTLRVLFAVDMDAPRCQLDPVDERGGIRFESEADDEGLDGGCVHAQVQLRDALRPVRLRVVGVRRHEAPGGLQGVVVPFQPNLQLVLVQEQRVVPGVHRHRLVHQL